MGAIGHTGPLAPFQRRFVARATARGVDTAALSMPRGNSKTWLAAHILLRCLTPGDSLHVPGAEYLLCAASIEQARLCYRFIRDGFDPVEGSLDWRRAGHTYRLMDAANRVGVTRGPATLRVMSSNGKTGMGIVGCPLLVADEPGAWEVIGGQLLHDAIQTAQGKPGSPLRVIYIGTLAPATSGWWHDLIADGSHGSTHVTALQGDPAKWDRWPEIRRCNPLTAVSAAFRRKLLEERDKAREDEQAKARFLSYRLNLPTGTESSMLFTTDQWELVAGRPVPPKSGRPIVGIDLGSGRAWSAATAIWPTRRVESVAVAPGIPDLAGQEKRDRQPRDTYRELERDGVLQVAEGQRVPKVELLVEAVLRRWGPPAAVVCDNHRLPQLQDAIGGRWPVTVRRLGWEHQSEDITHCRRLALDSDLGIEARSEGLLSFSISVAEVRPDDRGNIRISKRGSDNSSRDDAVVSFVLAAGEAARALARPRRELKVY